MADKFDQDFYNMINADVIRNKEIQKVTSVSPAQEFWKQLNGKPHQKKLTFWQQIKLAWFDVMFRREVEEAYQRGYKAGRAFEAKTQLFKNYEDYLQSQSPYLSQPKPPALGDSK